MSLRNRPYLPLYVQDYLTDEKLNMCSASSQGVYIKILCIFHKSENYGGILLKQKDKQKESNIKNFAFKLSKLLPFDFDTILNSLIELVDEKVLYIDNDFIYQKRMVKDNDISLKRSEAGKKGGGNPNFVITNKQTKSQTNPENEIIYSIFYDKEIKLSNNNNNYIKFVRFLFETNPNKKPLTKVLHLSNQITFESFQEIISKYKPELIKEKILNLENYTKKTVKSFNLTLRAWLKKSE